MLPRESTRLCVYTNFIPVARRTLRPVEIAFFARFLPTAALSSFVPALRRMFAGTLWTVRLAVAIALVIFFLVKGIVN